MGRKALEHGLEKWARFRPKGIMLSQSILRDRNPESAARQDRTASNALPKSSASRQVACRLKAGTTSFQPLLDDISRCLIHHYLWENSLKSSPTSRRGSAIPSSAPSAAQRRRSFGTSPRSLRRRPPNLDAVARPASRPLREFARDRRRARNAANPQSIRRLPHPTLTVSSMQRAAPSHRRY